MLKSIKPVMYLAAALLLAGCSLTNQVKQANDLIMADNELTNLLVEVRPGDKAVASSYLRGLGTDATISADKLVTQGKKSDAIAYYRIAATALWRSGDLEVTDALFNAADTGISLCAELKNEAPDRDCLFLQLVIPFAALESADKDLGAKVAAVNFSDGAADDQEIVVMRSTRNALVNMKPVVDKIMAVGTDDVLITHPQMRDYFCVNAQKSKKFYKSIAGTFALKVSKYYEKNLDSTGKSLGISKEESAAIDTVDWALPGFCPAVVLMN